MRILGLDLGTTSVGWALADWDESAAGSIVGMGVRIFPAGVVSKAAASFPPNQVRRTKRLMRRTLRRRRARRRALAELLHGMGLLPAFSGGSSGEWARAMRMDTRASDEPGANDPYVLRRRALSEKLEPWQLGRALYHLGKRRGFLGRDLDETADEAAETKGAKAEIEDLQHALGGETLGGYLATLPALERKRSRHTGRDMFKDEFSRLWQSQAQYYPTLLTEERRQAVEHIMFWQRPVFWRLNTLGHCRFFPGEPPAPKAAWATQQWTMLEQINKLRIAGGNRRPLDARERKIIRSFAERQKTVSFGSIRKALKKLWIADGQDPQQKFNLEESEGALKGNALESELVKIFGAAWEELPVRDRIRAEIHQRIFRADYLQVGNRRIEIRRDNEQVKLRAETAKAMQRDWGVTAEQAQALSKLPLPAGWSRFSAKAIEAMLPEMEKGVGVGELTMSSEWESWRRQQFPDMEEPTSEAADRLPSHPMRMPETRNPSVTRTLNEMRKVVNNIVRTWGKPDLIRIEMARDLRQPKWRREAADKKNHERERERAHAAAELAKSKVPTDGRNIERWLLWQEAHETCPYTGKKISFDALFRTGQFDVEHIWPRSRSLDNGFGNKTLCDVEFNRKIKGNRTPWEVFGHDPEQLNQLKAHLKSCFPDPNHPKIRRFLAEHFAEAGTPEFDDRQLRDTAYATVLARDFLNKLYPSNGGALPVATCNGRITAQLRDAWGLNTLLSDENRKNRADHRHHAIDALAVAFTTPAFVKRLSDWSAARDQELRPSLPEPWPSLKSEAGELLKRIVVSHQTRKKISGALHAETYYGDTGQDERTKSGTYRVYVTRKPLTSLTKKELADIRDPVVQAIVQKHVTAHGGDPKKAFSTFPRMPNGPEIRKVRIKDRQKPELMRKVAAGYVKPSDNHHIAVYRASDGRISFKAVPLFDAARSASERESAGGAQQEGDEFVMSLSPGDTIAFPPSGAAHESAYRVVTSVWASGQIQLKDHCSAEKKIWGQPGAASILAQGGRKVSVDPIGRVRPAHD